MFPIDTQIATNDSHYAQVIEVFEVLQAPLYPEEGDQVFLANFAFVGVDVGT